VLATWAHHLGGARRGGGVGHFLVPGCARRARRPSGRGTLRAAAGVFRRLGMVHVDFCGWLSGVLATWAHRLGGAKARRWRGAFSGPRLRSLGAPPKRPGDVASCGRCVSPVIYFCKYYKCHHGVGRGVGGTFSPPLSILITKN